MDDRYDGLKIKTLPVELVIEGFVDGDEKCKYEIYLLELINCSTFFRSLSNEEKYIAPISEDAGQCDAESSGYQVDFKLLESSSYLQAKRLLSNGKTAFGKGITTVNPSRETGRAEVTQLYVLLRKIKSVAELDRIADSKPHDIKWKKRNTGDMEKQSDYDISRLVINLRKNKNIIFFFPRKFIFDDNVINDERIGIIAEAFTNDFSLICEYRLLRGIKRDTFVCCVCGERMLFFQYNNSRFILVDEVLLERSETFNYLYSRYAN